MFRLIRTMYLERAVTGIDRRNGVPRQEAYPGSREFHGDPVIGDSKSTGGADPAIPRGRHAISDQSAEKLRGVPADRTLVGQDVQTAPGELDIDLIIRRSPVVSRPSERTTNQVQAVRRIR